jgi:hypothetical protein
VPIDAIHNRLIKLAWNIAMKTWKMGMTSFALIISPIYGTNDFQSIMLQLEALLVGYEKSWATTSLL